MIGVYLDGVEGCKCRPPVLEIWRHHWPRHHHRHHHHHQKQHFHLHNNDYHHHQEYWSQFADPGCSGWPGFHWNRSLHLLQTHHCTAHSIGKYSWNLNYEERRSENLSEVGTPFSGNIWKNEETMQQQSLTSMSIHFLFHMGNWKDSINDKWLMKASSNAKTWRWKSESLHGDDLEFFRLTRKKSAGLPAAGLTLQLFITQHDIWTLDKQGRVILTVAVVLHYLFCMYCEQTVKSKRFALGQA